MAFFVAFLVGLAFTVVGELLRPKAKVQNAKASAIDEFDIPTAEPGRAIPVFVGKVLITGSNVTWYGDLSNTPLKQKVKTGLFSSTRQTYAHRYFMGLQHALGFGDSSVTIHRILFGDYDVEPTHSRTTESDGSTTFVYNAENFFGGDKEEGGLSGTLRFYPGNDLQTANAYMTGVLGEQFPAYHGLCHAILEGMYIGTQKYLKNPSFEVSRYPNQLAVTGGKHVIGEDANPVCFVYELLTNQVWGVGKSSSDVDLDSFRSVAETVHGEGFGMSMIYNGSASAESIIADIMRHIDGVVFTHPSTGLLTIRLARNDYVKADLPLFDARHLQEGPKFSRPSWSETVNTVVVSYTSREAKYSEQPYVVQDLANVMQRGGELKVENIDFTGFTALAPVQAATARAARVLGYPLAKMSIVLDRRGRTILPADVIRISWPPLGIEDVVFRVINLDRSGIRENRIAFELVEDIYGLTDAAYFEPTPSEWVNPVSAPAPLARQAVIEMPYLLQQADGANVMSLGSRSGGLDLGYATWLGPNSSSLTQGPTVEDFSSSALTDTLLTKTGTTVSTTGALALNETNQAPTNSDRTSGDTLLLLKSATTEEFVAYNTASGGDYGGLWRGLLDTVQQEHPIGTQVWFIGSGFGLANSAPITTGFPLSRAAKLLPYNVLGPLDPDDATVMTLDLVNRAARPYPPGKIRVDGSPPGTPISDDFVLSWAHRNRLTQQYMVDQNADSVDPEPGTTYTIRLKDATDTLIFEKTGISSTATSASIVANYTGDMTVEITAVRDGLESYQAQSFVIDYTGVGPNAITADEATYVLDGGGP